MGTKDSLPTRWEIALKVAAAFDVDPHTDSPRCFACLEVRGPSKGGGAAAWNASGLQRCHVVPECTGGLSDVSNLVLMCSDCHRDCPEIADRRIVVEWIMSRPYGIQRRMKFEVEQIIDADRLRAIAESGEFDPVDFKKWLSSKKGKLGRHFGVGLAGKLPTYAALAGQYLEERFPEQGK